MAKKRDWQTLPLIAATMAAKLVGDALFGGGSGGEPPKPTVQEQKTQHVSATQKIEERSLVGLAFGEKPIYASSNHVLAAYNRRAEDRLNESLKAYDARARRGAEEYRRGLVEQVERVYGKGSGDEPPEELFDYPPARLNSSEAPPFPRGYDFELPHGLSSQDHQRLVELNREQLKEGRVVFFDSSGRIHIERLNDLFSDSEQFRRALPPRIRENLHRLFDEAVVELAAAGYKPHEIGGPGVNNLPDAIPYFYGRLLDGRADELIAVEQPRRDDYLYSSNSEHRKYRWEALVHLVSACSPQIREKAGY